MSENQLATHVHAWTPDPLSAEVKLSLQKLAGEDDVRHLAIMPDVHLAHEVCVGTVLATSQMIYPSAVGGDIGCGMAAIRVTAQADLLRDEESAARLLAGLYQRVPSNRHTSATLPEALPAELLDAPLSNVRLEKMKQRDGRVQFGTLGRGNHFLEFQSDPDHHLWVLVHSGSRAMGQAITLQHVESTPRSRSGLASFNADDQAGQRYLQDVAWAIRYAQLSRLAMLAAVESLLQQLFGVRFDGSSLLHSQHNHVQRETHFDRACGSTAKELNRHD